MRHHGQLVVSMTLDRGRDAVVVVAVGVVEEELVVVAGCCDLGTFERCSHKVGQMQCY